MAWLAEKKFWSVLGKPSDYGGGEDHGSLWLDFWRACTLSGMVQLDLAQPHIRRGRLKSPFPDSGLWIHTGLLAASRRNECQVYTGWLLCWQRSPGDHWSKKELKVMTLFFLRFPSAIHLWCWDYQHFQGNKLFLYKSLAAIPSCNTSGCPNTVTTPCKATKGPIKPFIAERNLVNFTTDTLNSEEGTSTELPVFPSLLIQWLRLEKLCCFKPWGCRVRSALSQFFLS